MGYNSIEEIKKLRILLDRRQLKAKIILASTREVLNVVEWLCAGADIVTVAPSFIEGMLVHPYAKETVQMFLADPRALIDIICGTGGAKGVPCCPQFGQQGPQRQDPSRDFISKRHLKV